MAAPARHELQGVLALDRLVVVGVGYLPPRWLLHSRRGRRVDDGAGDRLDPDEVVLDRPDPGHVLGGDAQCHALLLVEDDGVLFDDPVLDGDRHTVARDPGGPRQFGEDALVDLLVARRGHGRLG